MPTTHNSSEETTQTDGESPDSSDKPPHGDMATQLASMLISPSATLRHTQPSSASQQATSVNGHLITTAPAMTATSHKDSTVPLPPPEIAMFEKQPGHTRGSLHKLVMSSFTGHSVAKQQPQTPPPTTPSKKQQAPYTNNTASPLSSPTISESDWGSAPSTRPPSQAPSRAPSMSAGTSGGKILPQVKTPNAKDGASGRGARSSSIHSDGGGGGGHKFNLKDLLASGPKLARKSSARSTGSSHKSDSDGGYRQGGKSIAGDSAVSLTKKYGVCQKVAIGKGATSVVRLAHKWDRTEEKLYAVKVSLCSGVGLCLVC